MAARSLNKVVLIGNLTRDPELRYTPQGTSVCSFGLATNREWVDGSGQKQEEAEFHNIVAWSKLGEICANLLFKGRKAYVEGRITTRSWKGQDEVERKTTEIIIDEMIAFGQGKDQGQGGDYSAGGSVDTSNVAPEAPVASEENLAPVKEDDRPTDRQDSPVRKDAEQQDKKEPEKQEVEVDLADEVADDIPF